MLDFIGTIGITTTATVTLTLLLSAADTTRRARVGIAIALGAWAGLAVALAAAGEYADSGRRVVPLIGSMFFAPLVATALLTWFVPAVRTALGSLALPLLVGLNVWRVLGGLFVLLAVDGRLGGPFPHFAGWGDVITGVLAVPVAWAATRPATPGTLRLVGAWNAFGALDLVVAVTLGVVSTSGSPLQLIDAGAGSAAMQQLPWAAVPTVLVPMCLVMHATIYMQLRRARRTGVGATHSIPRTSLAGIETAA